MATDRKREQLSPRVNPKTWNKHRTNYGAFFAWLISTGEYSGPNPFSTLHVRIKKKGRRGRRERDAYSAVQIEQIFKLPLFQGCESALHRTRPGSTIIRDALYWAPLIAALHGMRREEICQIGVKHVRQVNGIWCFDLEADDLEIKLADDGSAGARLVPLHADFIATGFLEELVLGRPPSEMLFKELTRSSVHESWGADLGRKLHYIFKKSGIFREGEELGLHRFRHSFSTFLENTDAKTAFLDALTGHHSDESDSERARYTKEIFVENLKSTIDKLQLPIALPARSPTDLKATGSLRRRRQVRKRRPDPRS